MIAGRFVAVFLFAVLLVPLASARPLAAQERLDSDSVVPRRLSVGEAVEIARQHNPAYRNALRELDATAATTRESWGAFLPVLSASLSSGGGTSRTVTGQTDAGEPFTLDDPREFTRSSTNQGLDLSFTLLEGGSRFSDLAAARAENRVAEAAIGHEANRVLAEVSRRYFSAVRADRLLDLEQALLASAREQLDVTERLFRIAARQQVDVLGAQIAVAQQELAVARAAGATRKMRLALFEAMGVMPDHQVELTGELPVPLDLALLGADSVAALALLMNPRIARLEAAAAAAARQVGAARGGRWPTLRASIGYDRNLSLSSYEALFEPVPPNRGFSFGVSASIPLFSQFRTSAQIARAQVQRSKALEELRRERLALEREVREALIDLEIAQRALQLAERAVQLSEDRLELAREQFRLGSIPFTDLQTILDRAAQAERDALNARFDLAEAQITLREKAAGASPILDP